MLGREKLAAMGVSPRTVNAGLSPTDKAVIVASLMSLGGAADREIFVARTTQAQSYAEGFAYRRKAELTRPLTNAFHLSGRSQALAALR